MTESIFQPIIPTSYVENGVIATVGLWASSYLSEVERQTGLTVGSLERPRAIFAAFDFDNCAEYQTPSVIVVCSGVTGQPEKGGNGLYSAWFKFQLGVLVEEQNEQSARLSAQIYQAAMEGLLVQQGALGALDKDSRGGSGETIWHDRDLLLPDPENRTQAVAVSDFQIWIQGVVTAAAGPLEPEETPGAPGTAEPGNEAPSSAWPVVQPEKGSVSVTAEPI